MVTSEDKKVQLSLSWPPPSLPPLLPPPLFRCTAEMLAVGELYDQVASSAGQPIVVFNGELDRIRSGCKPGSQSPLLEFGLE